MFIMFLVLFFFNVGLYVGFLLANMFPLFMAPLYQRANMSMLLCGTLTSEYVLRCYMLLLQANMATLVYGILSQSYYVSAVIWNFLPTHMFTLLRDSTVGVIYVSYEICFYFFCLSCVWLNQIAVP